MRLTSVARSLARSLLAVACAAACHQSPDAGPVGPARDASPVRTDATVYRLVRTRSGYDATAVATYVNRSDAPVYYPRCGPGIAGPMFGYRRTGADSTRELFTDTAWACVGGMPTGVIPPGDSVVVRVRLGAYDQPDMNPPLRPEDIVGTMRVELELCARPTSSSEDCERAPQAARQSNAFVVRY
jgi:hypothetical protein